MRTRYEICNNVPLTGASNTVSNHLCGKYLENSYGRVELDVVEEVFKDGQKNMIA